MSTVPQWEEISVTYEEMVHSLNLEINENDLFGELSYVKEYALYKVNKWNEKKSLLTKDGLKYFNTLKHNMYLINLWNIVYVFLEQMLLRKEFFRE